jgi:hypothetical protein
MCRVTDDDVENHLHHTVRQLTEIASALAARAAAETGRAANWPA